MAEHGDNSGLVPGGPGLHLVPDAPAAPALRHRGAALPPPARVRVHVLKLAAIFAIVNKVCSSCEFIT